ncbi:hypothetical protein MGYG_08973 [Nannizzia gypsea CBS 118893]|uniref:Uncharacterized protein n=1 Tax=Arthroderma gypseum (strain ATCC MYA-4604 / CBS 118893) TaxID=535722 RepID=E4UR90_ARTGP|nr:hypothetical protein MGYG_08973 [Nannizzia gypsea CBS 118893]EFQ99365.1 hypothetical protein MGYG_08973 [Nannizzia gypsea CBS 118893]
MKKMKLNLMKSEEEEEEEEEEEVEESAAGVKRCVAGIRRGGRGCGAWQEVCKGVRPKEGKNVYVPADLSGVMLCDGVACVAQGRVRGQRKKKRPKEAPGEKFWLWRRLALP